VSSNIMIRLNAHFDGKNICPDEPVSLPQGVTLNVSVTGHTALDDAAAGGQPDACSDLADLIQQSQVGTGIPDLAAEHDHYLHGKPKRNGGQSLRFLPVQVDATGPAPAA
jgi:hypothetical protein